MTRQKLLETTAVAIFAGGMVAMGDALLIVIGVPMMLHVIVLGLTAASFAVIAMADGTGE